MNILSITAQKPHSTGSGTYLTELVKAFDEAGHKQAVVVGIYLGDQVAFPAGIDFYPVYFENHSGKFESDILNNNLNTNLNSKFHAKIGFPVVGMSDSMPYPSTRYSEMTDEMIDEFEMAFVSVIKRAILELKPDVILCHHLFLLTAMVREHFPNEKVYGICHGSDLRQITNCPKLAERVVPQIRKLDRIFALHDKQAEEIFKILNGKNINNNINNAKKDIYQTPKFIANDKILNDTECLTANGYNISVIGSGYNSKLFNCTGRKYREAGDKVRVCFAGKVSHAKGAAELLDAIDRLNAEGKVDFELIIAGGCQENDLKSRLRNLPHNVTYLGMLSQDELAKVYKSCDIFVLPSYYEGLGLVLIEAMASGLIPIATDLPGIKDWIYENVTNPNVRYIPMPEMAGIDTPTEAGRINFIDNLSNILSNTILDIKSYGYNSPDTSKISWEKVSEKILNL